MISGPVSLMMAVVKSQAQEYLIKQSEKNGGTVSLQPLKELEGGPSEPVLNGINPKSTLLNEIFSRVLLVG
jgi:hypothetical protein